jgi:hypothetical protein
MTGEGKLSPTLFPVDERSAYHSGESEMKSCPSCQQQYPDNGPEFCTNDGTPLVVSASGYGSSGYAWQSSGGQPSAPQSPPTGWQPPPPPGWGQTPGQYNPYNYQMPYPPSTGSGGGGLATAALFTGIGTIAALIIGYLIMITAASSFNLGMIQFGAILVFLSVISGLTALILGIVAVSMSNRNPSISKAKGIIGLCLGAIPLLLMIIGLIARSAR